MPLFKKIDARQKAKFEHKMCIAKDTPEPVFDLSECGLFDIPPGVFSMCKVFRKDKLFLQINNLTSLKGGGALEDLRFLQVLDLSYNKISTLPLEIGHLECLEVLNLADNNLKKLPETMSQLLKLTSLDISSNCFKHLQDWLCHLPSLQVLNVSNNPALTTLPRNLCHLTSLYSIILDSENFIYPPSDVCKGGAEEIREYLCKECEIDYQPSTTDTLSSSSRGASVSSLSLSDASPSTPGPPDRRRKELIDMEVAMRKNEQQQLELGLENNHRRQKLLEDYKQDQERLNNEILLLQVKKEKERNQLFNTLNNIEEHSALLISQLLEINEKAKSSEAILEAMEKDRLETEELFSINQVELEEARKRDVLLSMKEMLAAEEKQRDIEAKRLAQSRKNNESPQYQDNMIREWLTEREHDQQALLLKLQDEEILQRKAFISLQTLRDSQHCTLTQQIKLIEWELTKITDAEIHKKDMKANCNMMMIAEQRTALAELLSTLLSQRKSREEHLKMRLKEMEDQRAEEIKDYWLIQYQKLMDKKPQEIIDLELAMDAALHQVLIDVGAEQYVTQFAMAQLTVEQVAFLSMEELYDLGIANRTLQKAILRASKLAAAQNSYDNEETCAYKLLTPTSPTEPTAPSPDVSPSAPQISPVSGTDITLLADVKIWHQTECVICLDKESAIVFLPCGHVCSCWDCAGGLELCPLCRITIGTKITLGYY